jgi:hypothetical protein
MIASNDARIDGCMATECDGAFIGWNFSPPIG